MKNYTGVKRIKAEPMILKNAAALLNRATAVFMSNTVTEIDTDGYFVEYEDGYQSWSPRDVFEQAYRENKQLSLENSEFNGEDYQNRVVLEAKDLGIKIFKLSEFISNKKYSAVATCTDQLEQQQNAMQCYLNILVERIEGFCKV